MPNPSHLVELTDSDGNLVLINPDNVSVIRAENSTVFACIILDQADIKINVKESFEEIKKRFGLAISPRAETIARI